MSYAIYPLQFDTPVHFGQAGRGNQLEQVGMAYPADVLFSAICVELAAAHETAVLDRFAEKVRTRALLLSDLLPWQRGSDGALCFFVPRPVLRLPVDAAQETGDYGEVCRLSSVRKKQKKMKYLRASHMGAYIQAMRRGAPFSEDADFGTESLRQRVNTREDAPLPYYVGQFDFYADVGLYLLLYLQEEEDADFVQEILTWLGLTGIGRKRTSGCGKFHCAEDYILLDSDGIYEDDAALSALLTNADAPWQMALSPVLPEADALAAVQAGQYRLRRAGGFITAPAHAAVKKNSVYLLDAGSCFKERICGSLACLGTHDGHEVWRYGLGLYAGVTA